LRTYSNVCILLYTANSAEYSMQLHLEAKMNSPMIMMKEDYRRGPLWVKHAIREY